jgi:hypothetical protein
MNPYPTIICAVFGLLAGACVGKGQSEPGASAAPAAVTWHLDNLDNIAGHKVTVVGDPRVIETSGGRAIEFDGIDDGIFLDVHPLAGMSSFTVEVIFNPYEGGAAEQRFFHMQENSSDHRVMFETRLRENRQWFLDTFIFAGEQKIPLFAEDHMHETGSWYHAAIVVNGSSFRHFVDGKMELSEALQFEAQQAGKTSLGVRLNQVDWFRGAIRTVRITPRALGPEDFLSSAD